MSEIRNIEGRLDGSGRRFAVVASRFNQRVVEGLVAGALDCLRRHGVAAEDLTVVRVPGAWEIPLALEELAQTGQWNGLVALGAVIRGETPHFEYISNAVAHGLMEASGETGVPMAFGVLTTDSWEQAEARAGEGRDNKGFEAAAAALEMAELFGSVRKAHRR